MATRGAPVAVSNRPRRFEERPYGSMDAAVAI
jgi:hypothetical protein